MTTIDKLLLQLINSSPELLNSVPSRDVKVMKSLSKIILSPNFITENQGKLLIKVLSENLEKFGDLKSEISVMLSSPVWSKTFRPIDKTKKIYLSVEDPGIIIEFAYSSSLRKIITGVWKEISGLSQINNGKSYRAELTEKNIVKIYETFKPHGFEFEEKLVDFYNTIKSWSKIEVNQQFLLTTISHLNFQKAITSDLGIETPIDEIIIRDRSNRYQYFVKDAREIPENLTEQIAFRKSNKVWIDRKEVGLNEIFSSLLELKRLPALVIFDSNDHKKCFEDFVIFHENLEKNKITDNVGIYFRLPNDEFGSQFNKSIADNQYNSQLDENTKIVGVQHGKIPKFFLKSAWKPMSVIAIGNSLRQTKTAAYASCCDLIITYTDQQPLIETRNIWE